MKDDDFEALVKEAREADLLKYLSDSGYKLERHGAEYYVKDVPGLCVNPEKKTWYNHYTNTGRTNNALDCLTEVLDVPFGQAVYELTGRDITRKSPQEFQGRTEKEKPSYTTPPRDTQEEQREAERMTKEPKELKMPKRAENFRRMYAYMIKTRGIPEEIITELVHAKLLYQSHAENKYTDDKGVEHCYKHDNAVFVHRDESGKIVGGEVQGLDSSRRFKGLCTGTGDSCFQYVPRPAADGKIQRAYIFESAIDLLSFYKFCDRNKLQGAMLLSMGGLKPAVPKKLQEQGITIISCVDNDAAGRKFEKQNGFTRPKSVKNFLDNNGFKDWNQMLIAKSSEPDRVIEPRREPEIKASKREDAPVKDKEPEQLTITQAQLDSFEEVTARAPEPEPDELTTTRGMHR